MPKGRFIYPVFEERKVVRGREKQKFGGCSAVFEFEKKKIKRQKYEN